MPEVQARFYHETSYHITKRYFLPHIDFLDIEPRKEVVGTARGKPSMLQLTVQPAYCLTIHKVQALTIRHDVNGCLEGMFALGQLYVLWSRVTDPTLFHAVGLPPADLLDDVAAAWNEAGLDVGDCVAKAAKVTGEWEYTAAAVGVDHCRNVRARLKPVYQEERRVKLRLFTVQEILNPQPKAADVVHALLEWIDAADAASQSNREKPLFVRPDGNPIFPADEEWWLTELEKRKTHEAHIDLASDNIAGDNLTDNPSDAGLSSDGHDTESDESVSTDEGLPLIPRARRRLSDYTVGASHKNEQCTVMKSDTIPSNAPKRRLRTKTRIERHCPTIEENTDDIDALLAGAPGGKLHVSRDAYHDLPPSVQGAFKRGDPRIVVVDSEDHQFTAAALPKARNARHESWQDLRSKAASSTS